MRALSGVRIAPEAALRADANFIVNGEVQSNNIDYFTLVRVDGAWKFVNASFVSKPAARN